MIVLGATSEVSQAFVEQALKSGEQYPKIYLLSSHEESALRFAKHLEVKFLQNTVVIPLDITKKLNETMFSEIESDLLFCATGFLGKGTEEALYDPANSQKIIEINYSRLLPVINYFAQKMESKRKGTIIALSSVAGDRGRQSNFIYGSAKAGFTAYLSGLRNYLYEKKVHVMTVKPGFMKTKMTEGLPLPSLLTASPQKAASVIYKAYKKKKNVVYVLPLWSIIMLLIQHIPEFIFKKLKL